jgi:hypothetical protein
MKRPLVHPQSAELRARAIRSKVAAAGTLCSVAGNALILGNTQTAHEALEKVKRTAEWVRVHLNDPHHVPADSVADLVDLVAELDRVIFPLESRISSWRQ